MAEKKSTKKVYTLTIWCNGQQTKVGFPTKTERDAAFASLQNSLSITPKVQVTIN